MGSKASLCRGGPGAAAPGLGDGVALQLPLTPTPAFFVSIFSGSWGLEDGHVLTFWLPARRCLSYPSVENDVQGLLEKGSQKGMIPVGDHP